MSLNSPPWTCKTCGKVYSTKGNLKAHEFTHTEGKPFSCKICSKKFKVNSDLNKHLRHIHDQIRDFECDVCGKAFYYTTHLKLHMARHEKAKKFYCEVCKKGFYNLQNLNAHVKSKLTHNLSCKLCKQVFLSQDQYKKHILTHPEIIKKRFFCEICHKRMTSKQELIEHNKAHDKNYACKICKKNFLDETSFQKHSHNRELKCGICEKEFSSKISLCAHLRRTHLKPKQKCNICLKYYKNLELHKIDAHKKKPHKCDLCNKSFSRSFSLKKHFLTHTNERPHSCDVCNASFIHSYDLKEHIKSNTCDQHKNSAYNCKICSAKFINKNSLDLHRAQKHSKKHEKSLKEQVLDSISAMICDNETNVNPVSPGSVGTESTFVNDSETIIKKPRILQCNVILKKLETSGKVTVANQTPHVEMTSTLENNFLINTLSEINLNDKQNVNLLKDGFGSIKLKMKKSVQENESSDQMQRKITNSIDSCHLTRTEEEMNVLQTRIESNYLSCKTKPVNLSEKETFNKCANCTRSKCKNHIPSRVTSNSAAEFTSLPKKSDFKKSIFELYDLIEKRRVKC